MTTRDALWRSILENPDDDTPRLVLADWLDEHGSKKNAARAAFIRLQVELARTPAAVFSPTPFVSLVDSDGRRFATFGGEVPNPEHGRLARACEVLLKKWGMGWLPKDGRNAATYLWSVDGNRATCGGFNPGTYTFERGFVSEARFDVSRATVGPEPHGCGEEVREIFSAHPCGKIVFTYDDHEPAVQVSIYRDPARLWRAAFYAYPLADGLDEDSLVGSIVKGMTRAELGREIAGFVSAHMVEVDFERVRDYDDGGDYEPVYGPVEPEW